MLILTRKRDESIKIGDNIVVRVMRTAKGSVKIGIEAPASVRIMRGELNEVGAAFDAASVHDEHVDSDTDAMLVHH